MLPALHDQVSAFIDTHSLLQKLDRDTIINANTCRQIATRARKDRQTKHYHWALAVRKLVKQVAKAVYAESSKLPVQSDGTQLPSDTAHTLVHFSASAARAIEAYGPMVPDGDDDTDTYELVTSEEEEEM
jgi:hypothetical protein